MASAPQAPGPPRKIANSRGPVRRHWNDITNHQPLVRPDDFRNGSKAPFRPSSSRFRSTPNNGHHQADPVGPVRARSGSHSPSFDDLVNPSQDAVRKG